MTGGKDIVIPIRDGGEALELAIRTALRLWPDAIIEDAETGEPLPHYEHISFYGRRELLAFRDQEAADQWDVLGADPTLIGTLLHFILSERELTISIDDEPTPQILKFITSMRSALRKDLFASTALPLEAA